MALGGTWHRFNRDGRWQCQFLDRGKRLTFALGGVAESEANAEADQVEYLIIRLGQGLIELTSGVPIVPFLQGDGKVAGAKEGAPATPAPSALGSLRDRYQENQGNGTLEERTLLGIRLHFQHLMAALDEAFPIGQRSLPDLQG